MNKIIEFLSTFEPFVQFKHNKLGKITSSTDIDTIDCGYIWEKDYDDNLHCKVDDRFDIIKICLNEEWLDTEQVLKQYFNTSVSKFKDTQQLLKAYEALEKEFTKRSQRIADIEAKLKTLQNGIIDDETLRMLVRAHPLYKDLEAKLAELNKEPLNCSQLENGMSLCVIQKSKIAELKAKLAKNKKWLASNEGFLENQQLKQRLVEKDKELNYITMKYNHSQGLLCDITRNNQDKISFCIEKLEKVKEEFDCVYSNDTYTPYQIADKIDDQIKQLKEGK